jgi:S1-C subfamily serine protease
MRLAALTRRRTLLFAFISVLILSADLFPYSLVDFNNQITSLLQNVHPSVVTIHAYRKLGTGLGTSLFPFGAELADTQIGTGVVYNERGHVVTTRFVVSGGNRFEVFSRDGRKFEAVLVGVDPEMDLSVLQIAGGQLPPLPLDDSKPVLAGSLLFVVGNSFGIPNAANIATAVGYRSDGSLQVSANLAPGFSGGPVIDVNGKMVGLISAKLTEPVNLTYLRLYRRTPAGLKAWGFSGAEMELPSTGVVLAISSSDIRAGVDHLISGERKRQGFLGVEPQDVDADWLAQAFSVRHGVMISNVLSNSPAWDAGIRTGDILTQYLGRRISSSEQLRRLIATNRAGDLVSLVVVRGGRSLSLIVQLGSRDAMSAIGVLDPIDSPVDTVYGQADPEFSNDDDYRARIESQILKMKRDLRRQMDRLNALQRELKRLGEKEP